MSDYKTNYSNIAQKDIKENVVESDAKREQYEKVKAMEEKYNVIWNQHKVNINEIVQKFTPDAEPKLKGHKLEYIGNNYHIKADIYAGYLRIFDRKTGKALKADGTPGNLNETHLKILKKEEM